MRYRAFHPLLLCTLLLGTSVAAAAEPASVKVDLSDKGGKFGILMSTNHAEEGAVEFTIKNTSTVMLHEFLITPWKGAITALPYDAKTQQVKEEKLPKLAGVEDMKPGAEAILRLPLKAGRYVVFCDQPGHYKMGMVADFTVTRSQQQSASSHGDKQKVE
jgi:uncharacterized cupredoxin-like copper-binding protein